jgi:condensin complex subunit 2
MEGNPNMQNKWVRTAEAVGAGAKIYGYRVDNVHQDTYKMLNTLSRGDQNIELVPEEGIEDFSDDENPNREKKETKIRQKRTIKLTGKEGEATLEPEEKIDLKKYDHEKTAADPIFKQITKKFDDLT